MKIVHARVDGQTFVLSKDVDLPELKKRVLDAVLAGADFVDFDTIGGRSLSVLISPAIPVRFEIVEHTEEQVSALQSNPPAIDDHFVTTPYVDLVQ
jgi:hypothetical protein